MATLGSGYSRVGSREDGSGGYQGQLVTGGSIVLAEATNAAWFGAGTGQM